MDRQDEFISKLQCYIATTAIGPFSLRNQGNKGVLDAARKFLSSMPLNEFCCHSNEGFVFFLNKKTEELKRSFPKNAKNWGAARKAINLFLRDALYNQYLSQKYHLSDIEYWLEVPLDSMVAKGLKEYNCGNTLPDWPGLKRLNIKISDQFQHTAMILSRESENARVHLDIDLWLKEKTKTKNAEEKN